MVLSGRYQPALLGARPGALPRDLGKVLLDWVWHREDGIGYLSESMSENSYGLAAWERSRRLSIMRVAAAYTIASLVSTSTS